MCLRPATVFLGVVCMRLCIMYIYYINVHRSTSCRLLIQTCLWLCVCTLRPARSSSSSSLSTSSSSWAPGARNSCFARFCPWPLLFLTGRRAAAGLLFPRSSSAADHAVNLTHVTFIIQYIINTVIYRKQPVCIILYLRSRRNDDGIFTWHPADSPCPTKIRFYTFETRKTQ